MLYVVDQVSRWAIPALLFLIPLTCFLRGVKVYEAFVQGAEAGFQTAVRIIPFMVGMMVAISVFRASGAMELLASWINPVIKAIGLPVDVIPLAIMRPLSGGGALGIASELVRTQGADSFIGRLASVMQGSTDTTFYVLTVYFGSVGIRRYRYAITLGLIADLAGLIASVVITTLVFEGS